MAASLVHFDRVQNNQIFEYKTPIVCVCASTVNVVVANQTNGVVMDGITFEDGDRFLLKDQTDATENGVYQIVTGNPPIRHADADTAEKLTNALVYVGFGGYHHGNENGFRLSKLQITNVPTASQNKAYYQNDILASLATDQDWKLLGTDVITPFKLTVPGGVTKMHVEISGGGGGGGGGAGTMNNNLAGAAGGGGGAGSGIYHYTLDTTPGDILDIFLGVPGAAGKAGFLEASLGGDGERPGSSGGNGGETTVTGVDFSIAAPGGNGGTGGSSTGGGTGGLGGLTLTNTWSDQFIPNIAGDGGIGQFVLNHATGLGVDADEVFYIRAGALNAVGGLTGTTASSGGKGGGGGGGGTGARGIGGDGGQGGTRVTNTPFRVSDTYTIGTTAFPGDDSPNPSGGGGGGGGAKPGNTSGFPGGAGGNGGFGGGGYVRFSW
jgi:hypothetical protein